MSQMQVTNRQGFAPATITEAMEFSKMLADSTMVPRAYQGKAMDVLVCVQWGAEIGLAPMQALQNIAVINGKPSVYGDAAMALVQASPVCEDIEEYFESEGTPNPVAVCVAKRKGRKPVVAKFSVEDAKRAGLWGKQGPWQAYPKRMMQMRARGFALRDAFPDVLKGLITAEEAQDYPQDELSRNSDVNSRQRKPANPLDTLATPPVAITEQPVEVIEAEVVVDVEKVNAELQAVAEEVAEVEVVEIQEEVQVVDDEPTVAPIGYPLMVPNKSEPVSVHTTLDEWQDAYEDMAERVSKSAKIPPRDRMTKLKELRNANDAVMNRVDTVKRIRHTANYSQRLRALGAAQ